MDEVRKLLPTRIEDATGGTPVAMLAKVVNPEMIEKFLAIELVRLSSMVNVDERLNLQAHQVPEIAKTLLEHFRTENLADFTICFKRGSMGLYDDKLLRLDCAVIIQWMRKYLEEKYQAIETKLMKEKDNPYSVTGQKGNGKTMLELLIEATGYKPAEAKKDNSDENAFQRDRIKYTPLSADEVRRRELHIQYLRENYDPVTSNPKEGWMSKQDWLALNQ